MFWLSRRSLLVELCVCVFGRQLGAGKERKAQASLLEDELRTNSTEGCEEGRKEGYEVARNGLDEAEAWIENREKSVKRQEECERKESAEARGARFPLLFRASVTRIQ